MKLYSCLLLLTFFTTNSIFANNPTPCAGDTVRNSAKQNHFQRKSITIGIQLTHFSPKSNNHGLDYEMLFVNPGAEALIHYSLGNATCISTGLSYQYNKIILSESSPPDTKTITNEITIPMLVSYPLFQSTVANMELTMGFYLGQYVSIIKHYKPPKVIFPGTIYSSKINLAELFSADDFIGDIYVGVGRKPVFKRTPVGFDLFFRYRLKDHQYVNYMVSRAFYGIKLKYEF